MTQEKQTAFHEAGHCIMMLAIGKTFNEVTVIPRIDEATNGHIDMPDLIGYQPKDKNELIDLVSMYLAGMASEAILLNQTIEEISQTGSGDTDLNAAGNLLPTDWSKDESFLFLQYVAARTMRVIRERWHLVNTIAIALRLKDSKTLSYSEVNTILNSYLKTKGN